MRCKQCGYRLWNLPARRCPECGTGFVPSEFEFTHNSVQFRCPHCLQSYYGTGEKGHLVPIDFVCAGCQRPVHMDEMILFPTEGVEERQTQIDRMPWLERQERGFFRAWFATIGQSLVSPGQLIRSLPDTASASQAWWFATVTNTPVMVLGTGAIAVLPIMFVVGAFGSGGGGPPPLALAGMLSLVFAAGFLITPVTIAVWGLVVHGLLRFTGSTSGPLRRTYEAICYSTGANVGSAIPCLGFCFGWIWWLVSAVIMVKFAQKVEGWRAALAVLALPVGCLTAIIGLYAWLMYKVLNE